MISHRCVLGAAALAGLLIGDSRAQERLVDTDPHWRFEKGAKLEYRVEYSKHYRSDYSGRVTEAMYEDEILATVRLEVVDVADDGAAVLRARLDPLVIRLGTDGQPAASVFDSSGEASKKPLDWCAKLHEATFEITVARSGGIRKIDGADADEHFPGVLSAVLGKRLLSSQDIPRIRSETEGGAPEPQRGTIQVLSDLDSLAGRFERDTTLHDVPLTLAAKAVGEKGGLRVEGTVPPKTVIDVGRKGTEFYIPGMAFTGSFTGVWSPGRWDEVVWKVRGTMKRERVQLELHESYRATRVPARESR